MSFIILLLIFAVYKERNNGDHAYSESKYEVGDTRIMMLDKLNALVNTENVSVKWRRSYISACIVVFLVFAIIYNRVPMMEEVILYLFIVYIVFYVSWSNFGDIVTYKSGIYAREIVQKMRE